MESRKFIVTQLGEVIEFWLNDYDDGRNESNAAQKKTVPGSTVHGVSFRICYRKPVDIDQVWRFDKLL